MTIGAVALSRILPVLTSLLEAVVEHAVAPDQRPTLYDLEALTHTVLPKIGQIVLQEVIRAQGQLWAASKAIFGEAEAGKRWV